MAHLINGLFNAQWYLSQNPDVAESVSRGQITAEQHFLIHGRFEGRAPGPLFDPQHYLVNNPDVAAAVQAGLMSAIDHFLQFGASENREPVALFNADFYLANNRDVAEAVNSGLFSPVEHFLMFGQREARGVNPFLDLGAYMDANPDVAGAVQNGASALGHLLQYGVAEGRDLGNGVNLGVFANDPAFQSAVDSGNTQQALQRVGEVAPFLPTFQPPVGWTPPADTPIPTNFTPPAGIQLVIPPSVVVPSDMTLPGTFLPVSPTPAPGSSTGGSQGGAHDPAGDSGGTGPAPAFTVTPGAGNDAGKWTVGALHGDVTITQVGDDYVFTPSSGTAVTVPKASVNELIVNSVTVSGLASVLSGIPAYTGSGYRLAVTDTGVIAPSVLIALGSKANGNVWAPNAATLRGMLAELKQVVTAKGSGADEFALKPDVNFRVDDTETIAAAEMIAVAGATTSMVKGTSVTGVIGSAADFEILLGMMVGTSAKVTIGKDWNATVVTDPGSGVSAATATEILAAVTGNVTLALSHDVVSGSSLPVATGDIIELAGAANMTAVAETSAAAVTEAGQWYFDTDTKVFTLHNGARVLSLTLEGAPGVSVAAASITITAPFTVALQDGVVVFGGTATGDIVVTKSGDLLTFTREGIAANTRPAISSLKDDAGIPALSDVTMTAEVFHAVHSKVAPGAADVDASNATGEHKTTLLTTTALPKIRELDKLTLNAAEWGSAVTNGVQIALNTALKGGESLTINAGTGSSQIDASAIAKGVTIKLGGNANVLTGAGSNDTFIIDASSGPFIAAEGLSITGHAGIDTLRITGTHAIDLSGATALTDSVEILDLATDPAVQHVTLTALQLGSFDFARRAVGSNDQITITHLKQNEVRHTAGVDTLKFAIDDTQVAINNLAVGAGQDILDFSAFVALNGGLKGIDTVIDANGAFDAFLTGGAAAGGTNLANKVFVVAHDFNLESIVSSAADNALYLVNGARAIALVARLDDTAPTAGFDIKYIDGNGDDLETITPVGTLTLGHGGTLLGENFGIGPAT